MRTILSLTCIFGALGAVAIGCKSDPPPINQTPGADCDAFGEVGESSSCPDALCGIANADFCAGIAVTPDCDDLKPGASVDVCGVGVEDPIVNDKVLELTRSANVEEFSGSGPVDLSCYDQSGFPAPPSASTPVTLQGVAKIFSHGCESNALQIEVYTVVRDGSADDGMPDTLIGTAVTTGDDCTVDGVPEENEDCTDAKYNGQRWECTYSYPDVPSETELLIVTKGSGWAPLYEYNVYVPNDEIVDGVYDKDIRALAQDDYTIIPTTSIGKNIEPGNGAIGGEVHDCGDVRLSNAVVATDKPDVLTYFTNDETTPLPDVNAQATSTLGLYAALDIKPGPIHVVAAGVVDGTLVGAGFFKARIFPDAVTSVTFRGLRPFQLPQD